MPTMQIQYLGFELKPGGRDYTYRVLAPKSEARQFTLTISNKAFIEIRVPYQDAADICYQKLQRELLAETQECPLRRRSSVSDEELREYQEKHRPAPKRRW